jgi:beta-lactamase regulating signal transducer with metallopeptidase domain
MKQIRKVILILILCMNLPVKGAWLDGGKTQQIQRLQSDLSKQQDSAGILTVAVFALSVGCVVAVVVGAAIGSRTRRKHGKSNE